MDSLIALESSRFTAGVSPFLGGSLVYFSLAEATPVDFVRPTTARALAERNVRQTSGYPLVPYSNRIGDGRFRFDDVTYRLDVNSAIPLHTLHGLGWVRPWSVRNIKSIRTAQKTTASRVTLALTHVAKGESDTAWPWSFEAIQNYDLDDERLRWSISVTNRDIRPMPAGIGMHPFFAKSPRMEVEFAARAAWRNDARMLPLGRTPVPPEWNFTPARSITDLDVNNCFEGWSGEARVVWPDRGWELAIAADKVFGHLVVFTSPERDSIAIEPISHANNALNLADRYNNSWMHVLAPGETLSGAFTMSPRPLESTR